MIVINEAIEPSLLRSLWASWPKEEWRGWHRYQTDDQAKYATRDASQMPPAAMPCLLEMVKRASPFVKESFPDWDLHGAGLHMMTKGDYLNRHLDSEYMRSTGWKRAYSCVLCVSPEWQEGWGGAFFMEGQQRVYPAFNRMMLFQTTETSWHGVEQIRGSMPRCTLSVFFWSLDPITGIRDRATFA